MLRASAAGVFILFVMALPAAKDWAPSRTPPVVASSPADRFVRANGIRLQYVDWGGTGNVVLFLPGLGDDVHRFDAFARRFSDRFHVVGFSRRGQGASDNPSAGYDTETLVEDIRGVLDALHIGRVDLIGHSIAGMEMTRFVAKYPARVRHLVYLDAAYDMGTAYDVAVSAKLIEPSSRAPGTPFEHLQAEANKTHLDFRAILAPALAYYVINKTDNPRWREVFESGYKSEQIRIFKRDVKRGRVVEFHDADHFFFADPRKTDTVVAEIRSFLSQP
jgi:pimeloyl-ACP methyl ester carboxylesterase